MSDRQWLDWPGKSPAFSGEPEHPAVYHMLDAAAVAEKLIGPFAFPQPVKHPCSPPSRG